jgi:hypothetical protein
MTRERWSITGGRHPMGETFGLAPTLNRFHTVRVGVNYHFGEVVVKPKENPESPGIVQGFFLYSDAILLISVCKL